MHQTQNDELELNYGQIKKFLENLKADPLFRKSYFENPTDFLKKINLQIEPQIITEILNNETSKNKKIKSNLFLKEIQRREKLITQDFNAYFSKSAIKNELLRFWQERQLARMKAIFPENYLKNTLNFPIVYELSDGCSGQCNFCCLDPPPLKDYFKYTKKNAKLWQNILLTSKEIIGEQSKFSLCYFATEPLDNPDYEKFVRDFYSINNRYPQLTTIKYLEEHKRIIKYIKNHNLRPADIRFSITSLKKLEKLYQVYSLEDLDNVELVINNWESIFKYYNGGRARKLSRKKITERAESQKKFNEVGTPVCINGFIVNMVKRSIKLISPCNPNDKNPLGYLLFDEVTFTDATDYRNKLLLLINKNMKKSPFENQILSFNSDYRIKILPNIIRLTNLYMHHDFLGDKNLLRLVKYISTAKYTWQEIEKKFDNYFLTELYLKPKLNLMYEAGILI